MDHPHSFLKSSPAFASHSLSTIQGYFLSNFIMSCVFHCPPSTPDFHPRLFIRSLLPAEKQVLLCLLKKQSWINILVFLPITFLCFPLYKMILERVAFTQGFQFFHFHLHLSFFNEAFMNSFIISLKQLLLKSMLISEMSLPIAHLMRSSSITLHQPLSPIHVSFWETILSGSSFDLSGSFPVWLMAGCCSSTQSVNVDMSQEHDPEISSHVHPPHCLGDLSATSTSLS